MPLVENIVQKKCTVWFPDAGSFIFENDEQLLDIIHQDKTKLINEFPLKNGEKLPKHCMIDVSAEDDNIVFETLREKGFISMLGVVDPVDSKFPIKYIIFTNPKNSPGEGNDTIAFYYASYFIDLSRMYAAEAGLVFNRKNMILWAIIYTNIFVRTDKEVKEKIITILKNSE